MDLSHLPQLVSTKSLTFIDLDTPIPAIQAEHDGHLYASLPALCQVFTLRPEFHFQQLQEHPLLKKGLAQTVLDGTPTVMIRTNLMALWLTNLHLDDLPFPRDKEEILLFQLEAAQILEEAFCEGRLIKWPFVSALMEQKNAAASAYKEAVAVLALARQKLLEKANVP